MHYRPFNQHKLPQDVLEELAKNNPYIIKIYDYPDFILPHPTPERFQTIFWEKFSISTAIDVEIGCGSGQYLLQLSKRFPDHCFLGLELRYKRLVLAAKKFTKCNCSNILLLKEKGEYLGEYLGENTISRIHVNFPDPWPKKAHKKHRLLSIEFFKQIFPLLRTKGELLFKTDHQEYFQTVRKIVQELPEYTVIEETTDLYASPYKETNIETEFEQLFKFKTNPNIAYMKIQVCK
ncbi:MAG: tRNA (guanosine(46)-N7)-methyltransferase TrmB [SAR324 cluster bacterium]|nr:tRNA (guanosine(46)-N7)-methyltransferase TrmB [SAR324 cluster bacterium]